MDVCTLIIIIIKKRVCSDCLVITDTEDLCPPPKLCTRVDFCCILTSFPQFLVSFCGWWSHPMAHFFGSPVSLLRHCFTHIILVSSLSTVVLLSASQMSSISGGERERNSCSHTASIRCIYSVFGLLYQSTAALRWTVHHGRLDWHDRNEYHYFCWMERSGDVWVKAIRVLSSLELLSILHYLSVVDTSHPSVCLIWEQRDGPLSCRVEVLTTSRAPNKEGQAGRGTLSVNIPQVWERQRKGAGEEEGSGWIAALYGQSTAFPRVCGSDPRHDARRYTNSSSAPPSGATSEMLRLSLGLFHILTPSFTETLGINKK